MDGGVITQKKLMINLKERTSFILLSEKDLQETDPKYRIRLALFLNSFHAFIFNELLNVFFTCIILGEMITKDLEQNAILAYYTDPVKNNAALD